jgi:hypothetical protein
MLMFLKPIEAKIEDELKKLEAEKIAVEAKVKIQVEIAFNDGKKIVATGINYIETELEKAGLKLDEEGIALLTTLKSKLEALQTATAASAEPVPTPTQSANPAP